MEARLGPQNGSSKGKKWIYSWWQAFEEGAEILDQNFGPQLLGSCAGGNLCKSEIASKAISLMIWQLRRGEARK